MSEETAVLTKAQAKSLQIIRDNDVQYASQFADLYFPKDYIGFRRMTKCGYGSTRGGGMNLWAGGWLGKLRKKGLVSGIGGGVNTFRLTAQGKAAIEKHEGDGG